MSKSNKWRITDQIHFQSRGSKGVYIGSKVVNNDKINKEVGRI
jgi:hypothetical protein